LFAPSNAEPRFYYPSIDAMFAAESPPPSPMQPKRRFPIPIPSGIIFEELADDGYTLKWMEWWR